MNHCTSISMCVFEWNPSQPFWNCKTTTCTTTPHPPYTTERWPPYFWISHLPPCVSHKNFSWRNISREVRDTENFAVFDSYVFFGELYRKSLPFIFSSFFLFSVRWCTLALDHLGASTGSLITYKCLHITEYIYRY